MFKKKCSLSQIPCIQQLFMDGGRGIGSHSILKNLRERKKIKVEHSTISSLKKPTLITNSLCRMMRGSTNATARYPAKRKHTYCYILKFYCTFLMVFLQLLCHFRPSALPARYSARRATARYSALSTKEKAYTIHTY